MKKLLVIVTVCLAFPLLAFWMVDIFLTHGNLTGLVEANGWMIYLQILAVILAIVYVILIIGLTIQWGHKAAKSVPKIRW